MNIGITGATGLLGSNLLLEWVKQSLSNLESLHISVFGRQKNDRNLEVRVRDIVLGKEGLAYLKLTADDARVLNIDKFLTRQIHYVDYDLDANDLGLSDRSLEKLRHTSFDYFYHIASRTDFRSTPSVKKLLYKTNYEGTKSILSLVEKLEIKEFVYIGTSYSRGYAKGQLQPDFMDFSVAFRNPYETSKLEAEKIVREFCKKHKQRFRVFRPSTICGRLIEEPFGLVTKFDVFYSWVAWCLRMKQKHGKISVDNIYKESFSLPFRIACREDSGLNIVPADYAAKVIYQVCVQKDAGESYYLVNSSETPHRHYVSWMLEVANILSTSFVKEVPSDLNEIEAFYYKTVGLIFTPYVSSDPMLFDVKNLELVLARVNLSCPVVDKNNFMKLMTYAKGLDFGLKDKSA